MVSLACSTPQHNKANSRLTHPRGAPQRDVEAAEPEGTDTRTAKEQLAPVTSHEALVACQVCTAAPSFGSCAHKTWRDWPSDVQCHGLQGQHHPQKGHDATAQACMQALPAQNRY